jgi:hypothetical protein
MTMDVVASVESTWVGEGPFRYQVCGSAVVGPTSPSNRAAMVGSRMDSVGIVRINPTCGVGTTPLAASLGVQTTAARASGRLIDAGRRPIPSAHRGRGALRTTRHVRPNAGRPTSSLAHLSGGRPTSSLAHLSAGRLTNVHAPRSVAHPKSGAANATRRSARPVLSAPEVTHVATSLGPSRDAVAIAIRHLPSLPVSRSCDAAGHNRHHNSLTRSSVVARGRAR